VGDETKNDLPQQVDLRNDNPGNSVPNPVATQPVMTKSDDVSPLPRGQLWEHGTLKREQGKYYIWILSTPKETLARRNAQFLVDKGVGVSIELYQTRSGGTLYQLISEQGFASRQAAEPYVKKVRALGHQTPEYQKNPSKTNAWDDAYSAPMKSASP